MDASDGSTLWQWDKNYGDVVIPTPIHVTGHVYVAAGSNPSTCALIKISRQDSVFSAEMLYSGRAVRVMKNQVGGSVVLDGYVYGYSDKVGWVCQELFSGDQAWAARSPPEPAPVIAADGLLYCYDEDSAEVALVEANPHKFVMRSLKITEETAHRAPSGRNWTPPVIAAGRLWLRDQELLFCYQLR